MRHFPGVVVFCLVILLSSHMIMSRRSRRNGGPYKLQRLLLVEKHVDQGNVDKAATNVVKRSAEIWGITSLVLLFTSQLFILALDVVTFVAMHKFGVVIVPTNQGRFNRH